MVRPAWATMETLEQVGEPLVGGDLEDLGERLIGVRRVEQVLQHQELFGDGVRRGISTGGQPGRLLGRDDHGQEVPVALGDVGLEQRHPGPGPGVERMLGERVEPSVPLSAPDGVAPRERAGDRQLGGILELPGLEARPERLAHVLGVGTLAGGETAGDPAVDPARRDGRGHRPPAMVLEGLLALPALGEPLDGERPDRLEQPVRARVEVAHDEALVHQRGQHGGEVEVVEQRSQRLERVEPEVGWEHAEVAQQLLLGLLQQRVAPVDGRRHRLVPGFAASGKGGQAGGGVTQLAAQLLEAPPAHLSSGQLDGERQAVEAGAEVDDLGVRRVPGDPWFEPAGPFHEQLGGGGAERFDGHQVLVAEAERFSTGGQDPPRPAAGQCDVGQPGGGIEHVLAVVHHDQHRTVGQVGAELGGGSGGVALHTERVGPRSEHVARRVRRHEVDERRAVRPALDVLVGDGQGHARLAHASCADQRREPSVLDLRRDGLDEVGPSDQLGAQGREPTVQPAGVRPPLIDLRRLRRLDHGERPAVAGAELAQHR